MILIGVITDKKGFLGEMLVSNLIAEKIILPLGVELLVGYSQKFSKKYLLTSWRSGKKTAKLRIEGINSDIQTKQFMEMGIFIDKDLLKEKNPTTNFAHEFFGLNVIENNSNKIIGKVSELINFPANDVLQIDCGDKYLNLPYVDEFIKSIDLDNKVIKVVLPNSYEDLMESK